jgi:Peptide-N-glycosidase F, C terminal
MIGPGPAGIGCGRGHGDAPEAGSGGFGGSAASDAGAEQPAKPQPTTIVVLDRVGIGSTGSTGWANVGSARADVDWGAGSFAGATLIVDLDSACFPFSNWSADPPPSGQNWPADCDAFDRNFDVLLDDGAATPFDVIHAVTPFGGPAHLETDLTDLANGLPGRHTLRVDIPSYADPAGVVTGSNGGWTVSARIALVPGPAPRQVIAALPLYVGTVGAADAPPVVSWEVPAGATAGRIEYRTSGHGQGPVAPRCVGPAEEFCDRRHLIFVDGVQVDNIEPYREDCQTLCTVTHTGPVDGGLDYCAENPCGAIASVESPRANWCPGSMTPPFMWDALPALAVPGPHTFSFQILGIAAGGSWMASAIYFGYGSSR